MHTFVNCTHTYCYCTDLQYERVVALKQCLRRVVNYCVLLYYCVIHLRSSPALLYHREPGTIVQERVWYEAKLILFLIVLGDY